ncbi:MAG: hypothetical protein AAF322_14110 [Pseudomonadota bacterium]
MSLRAFGLAAVFSAFAASAGATCLSPDIAAAKADLPAGEAGFALSEVEMPEVLYLGVVAYATFEGAEPVVHRWPDDARAKIERWRFCDTVSVGPAEVDAGAMEWRQLAVALQVGVDYAKLYPRSFGAMAQAGQLLRGEPGGWRVAKFEGDAPAKGAPLYEAAREAAGDCPGLVVWGRKAILFPSC